MRPIKPRPYLNDFLQKTGIMFPKKSEKTILAPAMSFWGLIAIEGPDSKKFLQGQLTCDMEKVSSNTIIWGGYCNVKGRVITTLRVAYYQENYYLFLPLSLVDITLQILKKYATFSKVTLTNISKNWDPASADIETYWHRENVLAGMPAIVPETSGLFTPHDINLPNTGGVSFNKGCFMGQEIIARMHYRGQLKQHLYHFKMESATQPIPGQPLLSKTADTIGTIVESYLFSSPTTYDLLAVVRDADYNKYYAV